MPAPMITRPVLPTRLLAPALAEMRRFARDERGVTVIEFGILALPFFTIIFAIIQTAMLFMATQVLDSALEDASRRVRTGEAQSYSLTDFRTLLCDSTFNLLDCSQIKINSKAITDFSTVDNTVPQSCNSSSCTWTTNWEGFDSGSGSCRAVMQVSAYYRYPLLIVLPYFNLKNQPDNYRLISAIRVFRNEPFNASQC
jgi:Flp pilus assembly protein TadG